MPRPLACGVAKISPAAVLAAMAAIVPASYAPSAHANADRASATGTASAQVVEPIALVELGDLDFGIAKTAASGGGSVTVNADGTAARYIGGASNACPSAMACPRPHAARFRVTGTRGRAYIVSLPQSVTIAGMHDLSGGNVDGLVVTGLTSRTGNLRKAGPVGQLDSAGRDTFTVGGTLTLPTGVPPGHYHTTIDVLVAYN
ncbi:DUF4402 domain-containing protein [Novosphingobium sp. ZN18A2]|uniref:DUF4402 domain-containing protein n=1 Tax=Novosphingobium sp. ZN18A2 TaxID=3079861 RepID=UPI0030D115A3